jgi:hypothetical protein
MTEQKPDGAPPATAPGSDVPAWTLTAPVLAAAVAASRQRKTAVEVLEDGLLAGVIGYATMVLFYGLASVLSGQSPFYIPALLGSVLFAPASSNAVAIDPALVIAYNGVHLLALLIAGVTLAWLARLAAQALQGWYVAVIAIVFAAVHVVALPIWFGERVRAELPVWQVVAGMGLATAVMVAYLWVMNPDIRTAMHDPDEP